MNKRGEKVISVYWFTILFIVAGAVVYMVAVFYGNPYDVREAESEILLGKVADCLSDQGIFREGVVVNGKFGSFFDSCDITLEVEDSFGWEDDQIYIRLELFEYDLTNFAVGNRLDSFEVGNDGLTCEISSGEGFPVCSTGSVYAVEGESPYVVKIFNAIGKIEKNDR